MDTILDITNRQPVAHAADVASGPEPSQADRDAQTGGGVPPLVPAGSRSDLARALRLYGGPTLENQLIDAQASVELTAITATVAGTMAMLIGGEGVPVLPLILAGLCFVLLLMFAEAVTRRNRIQALLDDVDAKVEAALSAALSGVTA